MGINRVHSFFAAALDQIGARPPLALSCADGSRPYGVIWRTGRTAAGEAVSGLSLLKKGKKRRIGNENQ